MVRIYLDGNTAGTKVYDSLRGFILRVSTIEDIGLAESIVADEMVTALAVIY